MTTQLTIRTVIIAANSKDMLKSEAAYKRQASELALSKDTLNETQGSISDMLMVAAKPFGINVDKFLAACEVEQEYLKSDDAGADQVDKMSNAWIQAKSRIKGAMLEGLNPSSFETESSMREEVKKIKDERKNGEALTVSGDVASSVEVLMNVLHNISEEQQAQVAAMVDSLTSDVKLYITLEGIDDTTTTATAEVA